MDIGSALSRSAERFPRRRAVGGPRPLTYAQWDARTDQLARGLQARGVVRASGCSRCSGAASRSPACTSP
jgi:2-furoate---CoA ligase